MGNDLTAGHTWADTSSGKRVDVENLNRAFSDATLKETAISARTTKSTLVSSDMLLLSDGTLKKTTLASVTSYVIPDGFLTADVPGRLKMADGYVTTEELATTVWATAAERAGTSTTGTVSAASTSMTVASATGLVVGMDVYSATGITDGTKISAIVSTTVTLSIAATATLTAAPVTFYSAIKGVTPSALAFGQTREVKAWVNFNGTGVVAIRSSYNVSSITDNGTGDYTINFTTAMANANYCFTSCCEVNAGSSLRAVNLAAGGQAAGSLRITTILPTATTTEDLPTVCIAVFA